MTDRSFDRAVRDWLEDGSDRTRPAAIDAVLLTIRTTPQERDLRIPRRFNLMPAYLRLAAAVAVVAIIGFGALSYFGSGPGPGGPSPTSAPSPTSGPTAPPLTKTFESPRYGYTISYPAGWSVTPAAELIDPEAFAAGAEGAWLDTFVPTETDGLLRIASVLVPDGVNAAEWIADIYLSCEAVCLEGLTEAVVDGQPALIREDNLEREMIVIVGERAYFATLFPGPNVGLPYAPALFNAFMASLELRPEDAEAQPTPSAS